MSAWPEVTTEQIVARLREVCAGFAETEAAMRGWDCCTNVAARPCPKSKGA